MIYSFLELLSGLCSFTGLLSRHPNRVLWVGPAVLFPACSVHFRTHSRDPPLLLPPPSLCVFPFPRFPSLRRLPLPLLYLPLFLPPTLPPSSPPPPLLPPLLEPLPVSPRCLLGRHSQGLTGVCGKDLGAAPDHWAWGTEACKVGQRRPQAQAV